jgi:hypothetical protein
MASMNFLKLNVFLFSVLLTLTSCQTTQRALTFKPTTSFDDSVFDWSIKKGTGSIEGQAFLKTQGGDVKLAAGNEAVLVPVNDYTTELFEAAMLGIFQNLDTDPRYSQYRRVTIVDAQGNFTFSDLPSGEWYVMSTVVWKAARYGVEGGVVGKLVLVYPDRATKVIVTR